MEDKTKDSEDYQLMAQAIFHGVNEVIPNREFDIRIKPKGKRKLVVEY